MAGRRLSPVRLRKFAIWVHGFALRARFTSPHNGKPAGLADRTNDRREPPWFPHGPDQLDGWHQQASWCDCLLGPTHPDPGRRKNL